MIVNEVLCYIKAKHKANALDNIKREVKTFYTPDEITSAKRVLYNIGKDVLGQYPSRCNSALRPALVAHIDDLFDGIRLLDASS